MPDPSSPFRSDLFAGKTMLVTGGTSGIGLGIADAYAAHGARTLVTGRDQERIDTTVARLHDHGIEAEGFAFDVRSREEVDKVANDVHARYGVLDGLVNNAAGNFVVPFAMMSDNAWKAVIDIVLGGTYNCTRAFGQKMAEEGKGEMKTGDGVTDRHILNIVAGYAWTGAPGVSHSGAAKAAVMNLTKSLAVEWATVGVRLNCISPGPIQDTGGASKLWEEGGEEVKEMVKQATPMKRFGTPAEMGSVAVFLQSPAASYVTGAVIVADGGGDARGPLGFDQLMPRWV